MILLVRSFFLGSANQLSFKMPDKLCLRWDDFQDNVKTVFGDLRESTDFADVTLACEDGHQIQTHKFILAASSPVFQKILKQHKHSHPLIYMRAVKSVDLEGIVDFLYYGEATIDQDNLKTFLTIAEQLELEGLKSSNDQKNQTELDRKPLPLKPKQNYRKGQMIPDIRKREDSELWNEQNDHDALAITTTMSADLERLDETIKSMMEVSQHMILDGKKAKICKACGKEGPTSSIKRHIEANHLEGMSIPCNLCGKVFKTRASLKDHKSKFHKQH